MFEPSQFERLFRTETTIVDRPVMISELRTLIEFLPMYDRDTGKTTLATQDSSTPVVCAKVSREDAELAWAIPTLLVFGDDKLDDVLLAAYGCPTMIRTQRGELKVYKSMDALARDLRNALPAPFPLLLAV